MKRIINKSIYLFFVVLLSGSSLFPQKSYKEYEIEITRSFPDKEQELREIYAREADNNVR